MAARGPDGKGEWYGPGTRIGLTHRRLSMRWIALTRYLDDGRVEINNNAADRAFRAVELRRAKIVCLPPRI